MMLIVAYYRLGTRDIVATDTILQPSCFAGCCNVYIVTKLLDYKSVEAIFRQYSSNAPT
jgi:hypothetical protein